MWGLSYCLMSWQTFDSVLSQEHFKRSSVVSFLAVVKPGSYSHHYRLELANSRFQNHFGAFLSPKWFPSYQQHSRDIKLELYRLVASLSIIKVNIDVYTCHLNK